MFFKLVVLRGRNKDLFIYFVVLYFKKYVCWVYKEGLYEIFVSIFVFYDM